MGGRLARQTSEGGGAASGFDAANRGSAGTPTLDAWAWPRTKLGFEAHADNNPSDDDNGNAHTSSGPPATLFPDAGAMKNQLRQNMTKVKYDVSMYYHTTGFTQQIARHPRFEQATLLVIGLNALWIWIDTDYNPGTMLLNSPPVFQVVEYFFCMYFTFEWTMRFGAFKRKCNGLRDAWFVFDSLLVATMVFETWLMTTIILSVSDGGGGGLGNAGILRMARLLRLTRMARMARLLRAMPELLILIKGMVAAMRSVVFTLGLLFVMLYIFGIAFVQLCDDTPCEQMFPDVINTMHTLLVNAALMDSLSLLIEPLQEQSIALLLVLYVFILLAALTVMNMLIGVICEVVSAVAATEREQLSLGFVKEKINELMTQSGADENNDQMISKEEFDKLLQNQKAVAILQDVGVDVVGLVDFKDIIFEPDTMQEEGEEKLLGFADFMNLVLDLRGGNNATVKDMVNLRKYINGRFENLEHKLQLHRQRPMSTMSTTSMRSSNSFRNEKPPQQRLTLHEDQGISRQRSKSKDLCFSCACSLSASKSPRSTADARLPRFQDIHRTLKETLDAHEREMALLLGDLQQAEALQINNLHLRDKMSICEGDKPATASVTEMPGLNVNVVPSESCSKTSDYQALGQTTTSNPYSPWASSTALPSQNSSSQGDSARGLPSQRTRLLSPSTCSRCGRRVEHESQHSPSQSNSPSPRRGMPLTSAASPQESQAVFLQDSGKENEDTLQQASPRSNNHMSQ
mmetsp:Transcript_137201/g.273817  ORF Transcript_137201/g.273817 Transcript_137201/m.273817 type:complete len:744 (-) Transcript_137201:47-2278(-)